MTLSSSGANYSALAFSLGELGAVLQTICDKVNQEVNQWPPIRMELFILAHEEPGEMGEQRALIDDFSTDGLSSRLKQIVGSAAVAEIGIVASSDDDQLSQKITGLIGGVLQRECGGRLRPNGGVNGVEAEVVVPVSEIIENGEAAAVGLRAIAVMNPPRLMRKISEYVWQDSGLGNGRVR